jgi:large subunit ribosomal protein L15
MQLHDVHKGIHRHKKRKRVGRGIGSGHGKTSSKGHKGHSSRQGFKLSPLFEGGQMPLARRVPKRGFVNGRFKKFFIIVNLDDLEARFEAGAVVDEAALRAKGLVKGQEFDGIKILGDGTPTKALEVHATKFSASAAEKLAKAGGKAVVVPYKPHAVRTVPAGEPSGAAANA